MRSNGSLTVPLLWGDVTPVLAHREDVLHQEAAVVLSVGCTAVGTLQDVGHVFQQLAALQTWPACSKSGSDCFFGQPEGFLHKRSPPDQRRCRFYSNNCALTFVSASNEVFN